MSRHDEGGETGRRCGVRFSDFRFQIGFRLLSDSFQTGILKNCKNFRFQIGVYWFRLVQIGSDWFRLTLHISDWTFIFQIGFKLDSDTFQALV